MYLLQNKYLYCCSRERKLLELLCLLEPPAFDWPPPEFNDCIIC